MVLDMERAETRTTPVAPLNRKRQPAWRTLTAVACGLLCALIYVLAEQTNLPVYKLQINIVSDVPFNEETPRTTQLILDYLDGRTETLTDNRYGSAFVDARSSHWFDITSPPSQFLFLPAPAGHRVAVTRDHCPTDGRVKNYQPFVGRPQARSSN